MKKTAFLFLLFGYSFVVVGQTLSRQVISSFGGFFSNENINWAFAGGQPEYTTTDSASTILTQGFEQPDAKREIMYAVILPECDQGNGVSISVDVLEMCGDFSSSVLLDDQPVDPLIQGVLPGTYSLEVICGGINSHVSEIVIEDPDLPACNLVFYSGFAPNGESENQVWFIENITLFPVNQVSIFDRWGNEVWSGENYDNTNVVWQGKNKNNETLPQSTYFYVFKTNDLTYKGFVELIR